MISNKKYQIKTLLKGIETGDPKAATVVNENKYIQHNPLTPTGNVGLAELFKRLSKTSPRVDIVRIFEDGDYVFAHTDYDFNVLEIGFEVFRFEDGLAVEHWDNLQHKPNHPNFSGHTMIDGPTEVTDLELTEMNRNLIRSYFGEILVNGQFNKLDHYIDSEEYTEHNPDMADGLSALSESLSRNSTMKIYNTQHRVLAEGSFVLSIGEGFLNAVHSSFYDLYRVSEGKIVEHWDTIDAIPPRSEWKNNNGKF